MPIFRIFICLLVLPLVTSSAQEPTGIPESVRRGVGWVMQRQAIDGSWLGTHIDTMPTGVTSLVLYTLLECGVDSDHRIIRKGLAFMHSHPANHTYEAGMRLMIYQAMGPARPSDEVKKLTRFLLTNQQRTGWGYPDSSKGENPVYADRSNTQYALLGLWAAAKCGVKIRSDVWSRAAEALLDEQGRRGGWGYQKKSLPTGAMTTASIAGLRICRDQLAATGRQRTLRRKIDASIKNGLEWLVKNWSASFNPALPKRTDLTNRFFYYYLYGLERVGSLLETEMIGDHPWYREGSDTLLKLQEKDGNWKTSYQKMVDSCFALLFLRRGTRASEIEPRIARRQEEAAKAPFAITMDGDSPLRAWVVKANDVVRGRLDAGERISELQWFINDKVVATLSPKQEGAVGRNDFTLEHSFTKNAHHTIRAVMSFVDSGGNPSGYVRSNLLLHDVDGIETDLDREAFADLGHNLVNRKRATVKASSFRATWTKPSHAADGVHATIWSAAPDDDKPWVRIDLGKSVRASSLKLNVFGAVRLSVSIGKGRPISVDIDPKIPGKHKVTFSSRSIRSLTIRILERESPERHAGLREIELFR